MSATTKTHIKTTKLIQSLQLLSQEEFKSFHKWIISPWANTNGKLVELYQVLQRHHPQYESRTLTKEKVFNKLYPKKDYDDKWMRNLMTGLSQQVEKFLVHQRLEKQEQTSKLFFTKELAERHRYDWFEKKTRELIKQIESEKVKETEHFLNLALIHEDLYNLPHIYQVIASGNSPLKIADLYIDTFYSISKWRYISALVEQRMINTVNDDYDEKTKLLSSLTKYLDIPVIELYKERLEKGDRPALDKFYSLKEKYFKYFEKLPSLDRKVLIFFLINSSARIWMSGNSDILNETLELYKFGLVNGLLINHGMLSESSYANIVTVANSIGDFEFSKSFIENYTDFLPKSCMNDGKAWANAHWHYRQNNFTKSIEILTQGNIEHYAFIRSSKTLLIQSYFEASLSDSSYSLFFKDYCEAAKKYFKRDKVYEKSRNLAFINFIKYSLKFIKILHEGTPTKDNFKTLGKELSAEKNIQVKKWLMQKIEDKISELPD